MTNIAMDAIVTSARQRIAPARTVLAATGV
jgi:hypothetical protein